VALLIFGCTFPTVLREADKIGVIADVERWWGSFIYIGGWRNDEWS
jgi:hypothetical protein